MSTLWPQIGYLRARWFMLVLVACLTTLTPATSFAMSSQAGIANELAQADEAEWLIMLYADADDNVLEHDILFDLQEVELIGSTDDVHIVAQVDRYKGGYDGMDDWTSTKRYYLTQDDDMGAFGSEELEDLGEVNMADAGTLLDFIVWAVENYPARKTMLILSDHGAGWPGGFGDPDPGGLGEHDLTLAQGFGDNLWLMELDAAFELAREELGIDQFDVIGFDACLMSQIEVFTALAPHARYAIASEEVEPGVGWAYAGFLERLVQNPTMEGDELATAVVETYIQQDTRVEDPEFAGDYSPEEMIDGLSYNVTLAAVDLSTITQVNAALDAFATSLTWLDQDLVAGARLYAQSFNSIFGDELPSPYIDLGSFSQLIQNNIDDVDVVSAAGALNEALAQAVVSEVHGAGRAGATGIAIYFPVRELYEIANNFEYNLIAERFVTETQWDEFLSFHAGDANPDAFERPAPPLAAALQELVPDLAPEDAAALAEVIESLIAEGLSEEEIIEVLITEVELPEDFVNFLAENGLLSGAPAEGPSAPSNVITDKPIEMGPITLSSELAQAGEPVTIASEVYGSRLGYLYTFIGRLLPREDVLVIEDMDFVYAEDETTVDDVTYPLWPEDGFEVGFDWEPTVYAVSDGESEVRTLFAPESYGETPTYLVEGTYHFADGSPDRYAHLIFRDGVLFQVLGFSGDETGGGGAPREIYPESGDQFTLYDQGYYLSDEAEEEYYYGESGTLTFGDEPFTLVETPAPSGNYVVGFIAEDLDGETYEQYEGLFVVNEEAVATDGFVPLVDTETGFALLHPETWIPEIGTGDEAGFVTLTNEDETTVATVALLSFPDISDPVEADFQAIQAMVDSYGEAGDLENIEFAEEVAPYVLGAYDANWLDFAFEVDGESFLGSIVAATPTQGMTYLVQLVTTADQYESVLPDFEAMLASFDILISGLDREAPGDVQPEVAEELFYDEYTDPASGLYDELEDEWGSAYYDEEGEQYVYALQPASGAIYDYYVEPVLPDHFIVQTSVWSSGAIDTAYGLIFQLVDEEHFYSFRVSGDGYFIVEKADGDSLETLVDWSIAEPMDTAEEAGNLLAVEGNEGFYRLFVNGIQVGEFSDDSYAEGVAGYIVENFDHEAETALIFDDFSVGVPIEE